MNLAFSRRFSHSLPLILAALLSTAARAAPPPAAPVDMQVDTPRIDVRQFVLPNGLKALVYSDHSVPSVYVGIRYKVGSRDEPAGRTGFAHLFEHLMFQSTSNRKGDFLPVLTAAGAADVNGMTTTDWTEYHETVPTNALDLALWLESDRMSNLADGITQTELDEQRGVVENEKRESELGPGAHGMERYLAGYYPPGHPYAHQTIGSMDDIEKASLSDVRQWFTDYYGAGNAVIVLAGDIDYDTAKAKIETYFGAVRPGKPVDRMLQWLPAFAAIKRDRVFEQVATPNITRSWPVSNEDPRELTLLQLAARTMAGNRNSLLDQRLVNEQHIADGVSATLGESELGSTFALNVSLHPGVSVERAEAAIDAALSEFLRVGPSRARMSAVSTASDDEILQLMESAPAIGSWLIGGEVDHGDPLYFLKQRAWMVAATPQDVRAVTAKWLQRPYYEVHTLPTPQASAAAADVDRAHMPVPGPLDVHVAFPPVQTQQLPNGMKIVVAERHRLPLVRASLQFATGSLADPRSGSGVAQRVFDLLGAGTRRFDANGLAAEMSRLGSGISASAGARQSSVNWGATAGKLDPTMALVSEVIRHPAYPQDRIDRLNESIDTGFDGYERNPAGAADPLLERALWGADHPLGRITRRADAHRITRDELVAFHDTHVTPANATLFVVGDVTPAQARKLAERYFGDWGVPSRAVSAPAAIGAMAPPAPAQNTPRVILVDSPGAEQSTILAGEIVAPFDAQTSAAEALVNGALGGSFDSRLNTDLRENKGWAYNFGSSIGGDTIGPRMLTVGGSVQTDRTSDSITAVRSQIAAFAATDPISQDELDRERASALRALPSSFGGNAAILTALTSAAAAGLPFNRQETTAARLSAVTLDDARTLAARLFRADALTWVIVGDLKRVEAQVRALGLGPVEVWDVYGQRLR
ncbi:pitrilysin family protein [Novosphingobium sp. 11B]